MRVKPDLATVLEYYGVNVLDRSGWAKCKCFVHEDTHASAAYNLDLQMYNCLVCQLLGDVYTIIMRKEGMDFKDAQRKAEAITHGNSAQIRASSHRTGSVLPTRAGNNKGNSKFIPSWKRRGA